MSHIHTKLHIAHQIISDIGYAEVILETTAANKEEAELVINAMLAAPKYCIDSKVLELLRREDTNKSIMAIMQAGIARLPFNPMLVEYQSLSIAEEHHPSRYFVLLAESKQNQLGARVARLDAGDASLVVQAEAIAIGLTPEGFLIEAVDAAEGRFDSMSDTFRVAAAVAVAIALLMLNTKGIEKEVIHTDRINKARQKHENKVPIPHHTVVRIGTIYDRSGRGHSATGTGRHMPVHLRAGHTRHQHHGKNNEEVKIIYIPPCIVNFKDSDGEKPRLPDKTIII